MGNTDVSRLLGEMWRNASDEEKAPYVEQEEKERTAYKEEVKKFREKQAQLDAANRTTHQSVVQGTRQHNQHQTPPGFEAPPVATSPSHVTFENLNFDQIMDDPAKSNSAFRSHSSHPYHRAFYRSSDHFPTESYPQTTWSALSMDDSDPLPVIPVPPGYPTMAKTNNDDMNASYYPARNSYYSDRPFEFNMSEYNRYP
jgi:hypothetical protein